MTEIRDEELEQSPENTENLLVESDIEILTDSPIEADASAAQESAAEQTEESPEESSDPVEITEAEKHHLMAAMEAILFISDRPVSLPKLRSTIDPTFALIHYRELMAQLRDEFNKDHRGVEIAEVSLGFQLRTKPHMANVLRKMIKTQPLKLSNPTMEVLAMIAYKQPTTKDEIDNIRGVDSGYLLRTLLEKRLVRITGRSELPGRPLLYGTTHEFLELFSLKDLKSLPPMHEIESMVAASEAGQAESQEQAFKEFSKMVESSTTMLFDDNGIDQEIEDLRSEIAAIPTSTPFIEEQKQQEKQALLLSEEQALQAATEPASEEQTHQPSPQLEEQALQAQWDRHAEMISSAFAETKEEEAPAQPPELEKSEPAEI